MPHDKQLLNDILIRIDADLFELKALGYSQKDLYYFLHGIKNAVYEHTIELDL